MRGKKIYLVILFSLFLMQIMLSTNMYETKFESCISELMESKKFKNKNDIFLEKKISEIIFFKKMKNKGHDLKELKHVSYNKYSVSENSKYPDFEIQIWTFKDVKSAEQACNLVEKLISNSSYFEKPPKVISYYENYCIMITTPIFSKRKHIIEANNFIKASISNCM